MAGHAIFVPYPGRGHINPMMHLATKLASHGLSLTFVLTETWHKIITQAEDDFFSHARKLGLDIRAGLIPDCVVGESQRWANMAAFFLSLSNMEAHVSDLISDLNRSGVTLSCIVADTALSWAVPLAKRHALLSVSLWPNSVTNLSMFYFFHLVGLQGSIDDIPGVSSSLRTEFLDALPPPSPVRDRIAESFINVREADWVVVNSFHTLDCRAVEALRHKTPVQCVGPLNMPFTHCGHGNSASQCTQWLNSKPVRSVIYVSFGSFINVARTQVGEIAAGLMQSGYCFVWALRLDEEASHVWEMLPPGFLEECIPILGFPLGINCKLAVEEWKIAVRGRSRDDVNRVIAAQEIAGKVKMLMEGEESVKLRGAVEKFRELAKEEVVDGMSASNLKLLADRMKAGKYP
ncbi:hypothetical protein SUGI_0039810 [Cryptomeria japonica]|nr:hypothetical protein SUGI_0039810 [Cryptomeria japonica]